MNNNWRWCWRILLATLIVDQVVVAWPGTVQLAKRTSTRNVAKMMLAQSTSVILHSRGGGEQSYSNKTTKGKTKKGSGNGGGGGNRTTLIGRSRAGDGTCFAIPELKWMFDCGALVQGWLPKIVFITHTHSDHVHYLTHIKNARNPPMIYLPEQAAPFVKAHLVAHQEMSDCMTQEESQRESGGEYAVDYELRPTRAGEEITFKQGGVEYIVRTIAMDHRVPCLGYSIFKKNTRLKPEYVGLAGPEIGRLRKQGTAVTESFEEPFVCFMGDTTAEVFENHPEVLEQHKFVIVECSFFEAKSLECADITKHMHWDRLEPHVAAHPDTMFLLTHFSLRHSEVAVLEFFRKQQEQYDNVHPMLIGEEIRKSWKSDGDPPACKCRMCSGGN